MCDIVIKRNLARRWYLSDGIKDASFFLHFKQQELSASVLHYNARKFWGSSVFISVPWICHAILVSDTYQLLKLHYRSHMGTLQNCKKKRQSY